MVGIPNVVRRGGVYHFRRAVPLDLRSALRRGELTRSLETSDVRKAQLRSRALYLASEHLFHQVRVSTMLSEDQLARLVQDFYLTVLERENDARLLTNGPLPEPVREARIGFYTDVADRSRHALACNEFASAWFATEAMLRKNGLAGRLEAKEIKQAQQAMLRAGIDLAEAMKARYQGDFNHEPRDRLLRQKIDAIFQAPTGPGAETPASRPVQPASDMLDIEGAHLSAAAERFCRERVTAKTWEKQSALQSGKSYALFIEICGDRPIVKYTRKDASRFKDVLQQLPGDYGKAAQYQGLTPEEIIAVERTASHRQHVDRITPRTVKRHFSALSTLWDDAIPRGEASENIFSGFKFPASKRANQQREMWSLAELKQLFASPVWSGCQSPARRAKPGTLVIRDEKFWLPLIAVFSGMREEEICQLFLEDVREESGIWVFDVNNRPPRNSRIRMRFGSSQFIESSLRSGFSTMSVVQGRLYSRGFSQI